MTITAEIQTGEHAFDELAPRVHGFLEQDLLDLSIDGRRVRGFRSPDAKSLWIRDHSDMLRAARYSFTDLTSAVEHFAETQSLHGRIFDYVTTYPEKPPSERENWTKYVRVPVEADVEYRFVKAAYLAWQATGDDAWIERLLPHMERALDYIRRHPWYWDAAHGLVKRAYTIDTWDFAYSAGKHEWLQFQIDEDTFWGIMHGDNSGYYEAARLLSRCLDHLGHGSRADEWQEWAADLKRNLNEHCWNGRFYTHFVKLNSCVIPGVSEAEQLSLSNPADINRGVCDHAQAVAILSEYQKRGAASPAFAEWFSLDPAFPAGTFGDEKLVPGAYVNGGIMPLVGGELARAAFEHGHEAYGADILRRYYELIAARGETYLWYFPDGRPATLETSTSPEARPTDGWGSSAMLYALIEGLAGVVDHGQTWSQVSLSPRWPAAGIQQARVRVGYPASGRGLSYSAHWEPDHIALAVEGSLDADFHVLLPRDSAVRAVASSGANLEHQTERVEESPYVNFRARIAGESSFTILLARRE